MLSFVAFLSRKGRLPNSVMDEKEENSIALVDERYLLWFLNTVCRFQF